MFVNFRKALFCVIVVSLFPAAAAQAGHFSNSLKSAAGKFQQVHAQHNSQPKGQPGGGMMNSFKNKVAQHMGQPNGQQGGLMNSFKNKMGQHLGQKGQTNPQGLPGTQGQVATNQGKSKLGKMQTLFELPNIDPGSIFGKIDPTTGLPFPAGGGGTTTPPAGGGGTTTPPAGGGGTTTPPPATTPPPVTPPPVTPPPTGGDMGGGGMGDGGHHHHGVGSWLPQVIGAVVQARAAGNYGGGYDPGYSAPVQYAPAPVEYAPAPVEYAPAPVQYAAPAPVQYAPAAPVYTSAPVQAPAPQYAAAPVSYQAPVQYAAPAPQYTPAPVQAAAAPAPATAGLVIYAVEPLAGAQGQYLVRGEGFGTQNGQLVLDINGVKMSMETVSWIPNAVVVKFPNLQVPQGATVTFTAVRVDGAASQPFNPANGGTVAAR